MENQPSARWPSETRGIPDEPGRKQRTLRQQARVERHWARNERRAQRLRATRVAAAEQRIAGAAESGTAPTRHRLPLRLPPDLRRRGTERPRARAARKPRASRAGPDPELPEPEPHPGKAAA